MKLSSKVLGIIRGVGSAALIATAAGCAASPPAHGTTGPQPHVAVHKPEPATTHTDDESTDAVSWSEDTTHVSTSETAAPQPNLEDIPPPCGRG